MTFYTTNQKQMNQENLALKKRVEEQNDEIIALNKRVIELINAPPSPQVYSQIICDALHEANSMKMNRNAIVVSGLKTDTTKSDLVRFQETVLTTVIPETDVSIKSIERMGRSDGARPQLLKVRFDSEEIRDNVLKNASKLKNRSGDEKIFLRPSMTNRQRQLRLDMIKEAPNKQVTDGKVAIVATNLDGTPYFRVVNKRTNFVPNTQGMGSGHPSANSF